MDIADAGTMKVADLSSREQLTSRYSGQKSRIVADEGVLLNAEEWDPDLTSGTATSDTENFSYQRQANFPAATMKAQDTTLTHEEAPTQLHTPPHTGDVSTIERAQKKILTHVNQQRLGERYAGGQVKRHEINYTLDQLNRNQGAVNFDLRLSSLRRNRQEGNGSLLSRGEPSEQPHSSPVTPNTATVQGPPSEPGSGYYPANREALLRNLHGLAATSSTKTTHARTVMYDPAAARDPSAVQTPLPPVQPTIAKASTVSVSVSVSHPPAHDESAAATPEEDDNHPLRGFSEPLQWKDRPVEVFKKEGPPRTDDELRAIRLALVKRVAAAYGHHSVTPADRRRAIDAAAHRWFNSTEQHDGHATVHTYLDRLAGPEGRVASPRQHSPSCTNERVWSRADANALLAPLLWTMHGYLSEPLAQHGRSAFGSFAQVAAWCVDSGRSGTVSLFGEDWGAPPARVGRDPRYRPVLVSSPRLGGFEDGGLGGLGGEWSGWPRRFGR
jgi:hypothetical protein